MSYHSNLSHPRSQTGDGCVSHHPLKKYLFFQLFGDIEVRFVVFSLRRVSYCDLRKFKIQKIHKQIMFLACKLFFSLTYEGSHFSHEYCRNTRFPHLLREFFVVAVNIQIRFDIEMMKTGLAVCLICAVLRISNMVPDQQETCSYLLCRALCCCYGGCSASHTQLLPPHWSATSQIYH